MEEAVRIAEDIPVGKFASIEVRPEMKIGLNVGYSRCRTRIILCIAPPSEHRHLCFRGTVPSRTAISDSRNATTQPTELREST